MIICISPGGQSVTQAQWPASAILIGTIGGVYTLERSETNQGWSVARRTLDDVHVSALLNVPDANLVFAAAHSGGLFASEDLGATWTRAMTGILPEHEHVFCLAAQPRGDATVLWAGTQPAALYRSDDLGKSWTEVPAVRATPGRERWDFPAPPHEAHVKNVAFHASQPATLYVCVEQGALLKSTDGGATWRELTGYVSADDIWYHDAHRIVISAKNPARLYFSSGEGLYRSDDAGETWTHLMTRHDRIGYPDAFFIDPRDERTLYLAGGGTSPDQWRQTGESRSGILRSTDEGATWEELRNGLPDPLHGNVEAMSLHRWLRTVGLFAATTAGDVYASEDRGDEWELIASGLPPVSKVGHYRAFIAH